MRTIIAVFFTLSLLSSCVGVKGNGQVETEVRNVENFTKIDVSGAVNVFIKQGDAAELTIKADENLMEFIETSVRGGKLSISTKKNLYNYKKLDVYLTVQKLEEVDVSGACDIKGTGTFSSKYCKIEASGASDITLNLDCDAVQVDLSGASDVNLSGAAEVLEIDVSGSSDVNAYKLVSKRCKVNASGASGVKVTVDKKLTASASGASSISYRGNPKDVNQSTSGAASISQN